MSWWGKLLGGAFGFMVGGVIGALIGAALGHNFDKGVASLPEEDEDFPRPGDQERVQTAFFTATFSVMGHLAKADGQVSRNEIAVAEAVMAEMELSAELRRAAIRLFDQGKAADFPFDEVLDQFRRECHRRTNLIQMFLEIQLQAAYADGGRMEPVEEELLLRACKRLGVPEFLFRRLERMVQAEFRFADGGQSGGDRSVGAAARLQDAYAILGVTADTPAADVKKAYRRLMNQHHPDKLVAKGLPEEMMKMAEQKTREIKQAYELVKAARNIK